MTNSLTIAAVLPPQGKMLVVIVSDRAGTILERVRRKLHTFAPLNSFVFKLFDQLKRFPTKKFKSHFSFLFTNSLKHGVIA
jgi:hypothetical protein